MKNYTSSADLYLNPPRAGDPAFDRLFLLARVEEKDNATIVLSIDDTTPLVALDDATAARFNLGPDALTVSKVRESKSASPYLLISSGTFLWASTPGQDDKLLMLQRDHAAPCLPGAWTEPAGRCASHPLQTASEEFLEEALLLLRKKGQNVWKPVVIEGNTYQGESPLGLKARQINDKSHMLADLGVPYGLIDDKTAHTVSFQERPCEEGLYKSIVVNINGKEAEPFQAMPLFDRDHNTLEMRHSLVLNLDPHDHFVFLDGEKFCRKTGSFTPKDLLVKGEAKEIKLCEAVKTYVSAVAKEPSAPGHHPRTNASLTLR